MIEFNVFVEFCFFLFSQGLCYFWSKTKTTKKNKKKQDCKTHEGTSWWVRVCSLVFFCFFCFLEVFATFGQKPKKHVGTSWWVRVCNFCFFFCFFWFSRCFCYFWSKTKKTSRKPKKTKKTKLQTLTHQLVPTWVLQFSRKPKKTKKQNCKTHVGTSWWVRVCNFVFFVFLVFSRFFWFLTKSSKNIEKTKKMQDPCRYKLVR